MRRLLLLIPLVLAACGSARAASKPIEFAAATLIVEVNGTDGDAGLQFFLDSDDPWRVVDIYNPAGGKMLHIETRSNLRSWGQTELFTESNEPSFDEVPLHKFLDRFPAGKYPFTGETIDGTPLKGVAVLSHHIPKGPTVTVSGSTVSWVPAVQPAGVTLKDWQVTVEQEGVALFSINMPADATQVTVPDGFLQPGIDYLVEVLAIDKSGNQTITESTLSA